MTDQLLNWSKGQYSHLPWRLERSLYRTLVSEIMLQQTTVGTVKNHFDKFLTQFPNLESLAQSSEDEMSIAWKGLGYYRRARNLRSAAIEIQDKFQGQIPVELDELLKIKGIGPYTAGAIRAIGANLKALAVDANVERVLARYYMRDEEKGLKLQRRLQSDFDQKKLLKTFYTEPRATHEALMDVGRVYCQARKAQCTLCPLRSGCLAFKNQKTLEYPVVSQVKKEMFELDLLRVVVREKKRILGYKKSSGQWLEGQVEPPTYILKSSDPKIVQYPLLKKKIKLDQAKIIKTGITKYKITNYIIEMALDDLKKLSKDFDHFSFYSCDGQKENLATSTLKILNTLGEKQ